MNEILQIPHEVKMLKPSKETNKSYQLYNMEVYINDRNRIRSDYDGNHDMDSRSGTYLQQK